MGWVALLSFLSFIGYLFWAAIRSPYTPELASLLAIFIALLFIGCCDFTPILLQQGRLMFFCTAGLMASETIRFRTPLRQNAELHNQV
jgi:hypothetical protein